MQTCWGWAVSSGVIQSLSLKEPGRMEGGKGERSEEGGKEGGREGGRREMWQAPRNLSPSLSPGARTNQPL